MVAFAYDKAAPVRTLRITQGRPYRVRFQATTKPSGAPVPLTGWSIAAIVTLRDQPVHVMDFTVETDDELRGMYSIRLTAEQAAELEVGSYSWLLSMVDPDQDFHADVKGILEVAPRGVVV